MYKLFFSLCLFTLSATAGTWNSNESLYHDTMRFYDVYEPDTVSSNPPLVIVLHGGNGSKNGFEDTTQSPWINRANEEGFILAVPNGAKEDGTSGRWGSFHWNDCRVDPMVADDVGFISAMINEIVLNYQIDQDKVYVTGISNGGMMTLRLAQELPNRLTAVAAVIANKPFPSDCDESYVSPVSVLLINGTADPLMPWEGGEVSGTNGGSVISAEGTRDFFIDLLDTEVTPYVHVDFEDLDPNDNSTVSLDRYVGGNEGTEVEFYTVEGGGHFSPSIEYVETGWFRLRISGDQNHDIETSYRAWLFFSRFTNN